jgi:hypothetical protein
MNGSTVTDTFTYGRKLVDAGFHGIYEGIREGTPVALHGRHLSDVVSDSVPTIVTLAAAGASVALVASHLMHKRGRASKTWIYGAVGTAVGVVAGVSWKSRKIASSLAHSAMKEVNKTRDEHWLELNPIDYA